MGMCAYSSLRDVTPPIPKFPEYDYDGYTFYTDEDTDTVSKFVEFLESPRFKLKMYFRGRDPLDEFENNIETIRKRCRRIVIFLTPTFLESPVLQIVSDLRATMNHDQAEKFLLPLVILPCDIPSYLSEITTFNFTIDEIQGRMWEKLLIALMPERRTGEFLFSVAKRPLRSEHFPVLVNGRISEVPFYDMDQAVEVEELKPAFKY